MLNQTLKNTVAPWMEKGRWYHAFIESNGSTGGALLTNCDLEGCSVTGSTFSMPSDFHIIDYVIADFDLAISKTLSKAYKTTTAGKEYIAIPNGADFTYCDIWFFGYFKE